MPPDEVLRKGSGVATPRLLLLPHKVGGALLKLLLSFPHLFFSFIFIFFLHTFSTFFFSA